MNIVSLYQQKPDLKKFLELLLSLTAVAMFSFFAIKPTVITIISLTKEIKAKENTVAKMDEKIAGLKSAQNIFYQQKSAIDILDLAIPSSPSPETAIRQIEALINTNSITPGNITYSSATVKGKNLVKISKDEMTGLPKNTKIIGLTVSGKGTFESIKTFLSTMENMRRPVKIDTFNVSQKIVTKDETTTDELNFSLTGRIPFYEMAETNIVATNPK